MKNVLIILIFPAVIYNNIYAQTNNHDYDILAKYSILRYTLLKDFKSNSWNDSVWMQSSISDLYSLCNNKVFKYKIDKLWNSKRYEIIKIIDETNFQLHHFNTTFFVIDQYDLYGRYYELTFDNLEKFISDRLVINRELNDSARNTIINLYNIMFINNEGYTNYSTDFMDSITDKRFKILDEKYGFPTDLFKFNNADGLIYQERAFRLCSYDSDRTEYWLICYFFTCERFYTQKKIVLCGPNLK